MTRDELILKIKQLAPQVYKSSKKAEEAAVEYDELTKSPELKKILVDLLTTEFDNFLSSIDWVSPRPTTFRINLKNGQSFFLMYGKRSWIAQIEGKKYYLLNLPEEERAAEAIARILRYGKKEEEGGEELGGAEIGGDETSGGEKETPTETTEETPEI
jgi:hypothetical protein